MNVADQPPDGWIRPDMTRIGFDAACHRLEQLYPGMSQTSGRRSLERNEAVGGKRTSYHVLGLAKDYVFDTEPQPEDIALLYVICKALGLKTIYHDTGSGDHLHVQSP